MSKSVGYIPFCVFLLSILSLIYVRENTIRVFWDNDTDATTNLVTNHPVTVKVKLRAAVTATAGTASRAFLQEEMSVVSSTSPNVKSSFGSINEDAHNVSTNPIDSRRHSRVLVGIFSGDFIDDARYRYAFRELFQTHPKVCSLVDFIADEKVQTGPCELIYTFVLGGNVDENAPTQIVSNSSTIPILAPKKPKSVHSNDFHEDDIIFLNIK
jgi:hypothetical protein